MRAPFIAALAVLGMAACGQSDDTTDGQASATADHARAMNSDANADAAAQAAAADASKVTSVDDDVGP